MDVINVIYNSIKLQIPTIIKLLYLNLLGVYDRLLVVKDKHGKISLSNLNDLKYLLYYNNFYVCKKLLGNSYIMIVDKDVSKSMGTTTKISVYDVDVLKSKFLGNYLVVNTFTYISIYQQLILYKLMLVYVKVFR